MTMTMPETATTTQPETAESPFSGIPAGWKIDADTPDPTVTSPGQDMYIISIHPSFLPESADKVGTIEKAFYSVDEWIFLNSGYGFYATAALVNPPLAAHTCYYLESIKAVAATGEGARLLRRVREDGSQGDILSAGVLDEPWIRVVRDVAETSLQPETTALPFPFPVGKVPESPTLGLEDSTNPVLNPEPVAGATYVAWDKTWITGNYSQIQHCLADPEGGLWFSDGGRFRMDEGGVARPMSNMQSGVLRGLDALKAGFNWIKAEPRRLALGDGPVDLDIARQTTVIDERKETYSEALNELAENHDWCSEYEAVVQPMGFPGRQEQAKDYTVELSVTFEMEDGGVTSSMDNRVAESVFSDNVSSLSLDSMSYAGTLRFSMAVNGVKPTPPNGTDSLESRIDDGIRNRLDTADVESALEALLPGSFNVLDWDIQSVEESD